MKKFIISFLFLCFIYGANAQSNVIKTNPLALAFGNFNVTYERVINTSSSVLVQGSYMFKLLGYDVSSAGLGVGYRYYITHNKKSVPSGFYVNPEIGYSFGKIKYDDGTTESLSTIGIGAELGYQWAWSSGFALDLGIGPMYNIVSSDDSDIKNSISPVMTLAIGYAF